MSGSKAQPSSLDDGFSWLKLGKFIQAVDFFRRSQPSLERDLGLGEALLGTPDGSREAYRVLLEAFLDDSSDRTPAQRRRIVDLLRQAAHVEDQEVARLLDGLPAEAGPDRKNSVLKAFFLRCPPGADRRTLWERVTDAQQNIGMRQERTLAPEGYTLQFAKTFSSVTPLMDLSPDGAAGGGYFLNLGGFGCVVDPGYGFLQNFYALKHTLYDIDYIFVTHFHDDHYADLPALLSLLHHRKPIRGRAGVRLFLDSETYRRFQPIIDFSTQSSRIGSRRQTAGYIQDAAVLRRHGQGAITLADNTVVQTFPTKHNVFGRNTGVGLEFTIPRRQKHVVITGDTGWMSAII